jgi:hypothetical protein
VLFQICDSFFPECFFYSCRIPAEVFHEVVPFLPELLDDSQHNAVCTHLLSLFEKDTHPDLAMVILDAISNLTISSQMSKDIVDLCLERINSQRDSDLPITLRFLFQSATADNAIQVRAFDLSISRQPVDQHL